MWEIHKSGSERGVKLFYKAEYCGTPQSKEGRNREYKVCLNDRALRLLDIDQDVTWKSGSFSAAERGDFLKDSGIFKTRENGAIRARLCMLSFAGGTCPGVVDKSANGKLALTSEKLLLTSWNKLAS